MSLSDYIPTKFLDLFSDQDFSKALDGYFTYRVKEDSIFRESVKEIIKEEYKIPDFKIAVEAVIATSELKPIKRITTIETVLGLNDMVDYEDEKREPTIPEQISILSEKIENLSENIVNTTEKPIETMKTDIDIIPQTATEHRACELVQHLKSKVKSGKEEVFLTSREIMNLLKNGIQEEYRVRNDVTNIRQVKKDVIEKAKSLFPSNILLSKKSNGHKEVRVIFRQLS